MPAIVTDVLRRKIARDFFDAFTAQTDLYYIGIGRAEKWDSSDIVPTPIDNPGEITRFQQSLQGVKKVSATSLVVPRNNWSKGNYYAQYDDQTAGYGLTPYYVKTDNNQVFICLETGRDKFGIGVPSVVEPKFSNNDSFRTSDGYVWKFLYTISAANANDFMSSNFMPCQRQGATDSNSTGIELKQEEVQDAAVSGEILSVIVTNNGSGYTSPPTLTITDVLGNGVETVVTIDSSTNTVSKIEIKDSGSTQLRGSNYTRPIVTLSGGGGQGATARAVIGPDSGLGRDAREDLKASGIMFFSKFQGTDSDFIVDQDFRQIGLIKDPKRPQGTFFTETTGNALKRMRLSNTISTFTADKLIEGQTTLARAYIDEVDGQTIFYHQTNDTGFIPFQNGEQIQETNGSGDGLIDSAEILPEVEPTSGDVLYIDNRSPVERATAQAEDIKVIIQF